MTKIGLWLFFNDYGYSNNIQNLFIMVIALMVYAVNLCYVTKDVIKHFVSFALIIFLCLILYIIHSVTAADIPQYGTQSQKQMLLLCLKHEKNNKLSDDEQKHISNTINNIMETCYKNYLNNEQYAKKLLEEQKQELKDKEVLESLNKMMDNQ